MERKYTIKDDAVKTALSCISDLVEESGRNIVVSGGIANHLHNEKFSDYFRPTDDLDLATFPYLGRDEFFNSLGITLVDKLCMEGYDARIKKRHHNFEVRLIDNEDNLCIHFDRMSNDFYEKTRDLMQRMVSDSEKMNVPCSSKKISVIKPEQILNNKSDRIGRMLKNFENNEECRQLYDQLKELDFEGLSKQKILPWLSDIVEERDILKVMPKNEPSFHERLKDYKIQKDCYDVCLISKSIVTGNIKFDKAYFESLKEYNITHQQKLNIY